MSRVYERHGLRFEYPDDWILHEESSSEEITLTVHSPDTAFWSLSLLPSLPDPEHVVDSVLDTFRELYTEVDFYPAHDCLQDQPTIACDIDFVCHELISTACLRATTTSRFTLLVLYQAADFELEDLRPVLERLSHSLHWDFGETEPLDDTPLFPFADEHHSLSVDHESEE